MTLNCLTFENTWQDRSWPKQQYRSYCGLLNTSHTPRSTNNEPGLALPSSTVIGLSSPWAASPFCSHRSKRNSPIHKKTFKWHLNNICQYPGAWRLVGEMHVFMSHLENHNQGNGRKTRMSSPDENTAHSGIWRGRHSVDLWNEFIVLPTF